MTEFDEDLAAIRAAWERQRALRDENDQLKSTLNQVRRKTRKPAVELTEHQVRAAYEKTRAILHPDE